MAKHTCEEALAKEEEEVQQIWPEDYESYLGDGVYSNPDID